MTEFETMKNDMNSNLYPSPPPGSPPPISIDCNKYEQDIISLPPPPTQDEIERLRIMNGVGESQDKLVEFLLYDDRIRGVDDIEWNDYGYENRSDINFPEEYDEDYVCSDEEEEHKNYQRNEALECYGWYRLNDSYKDIFNYNGDRRPTYSFKDEIWVLNVNNFLKNGL